MEVCGCTSGMLFWKKPCDRIALDSCATCGTGLCANHARRPRPGRFYCPDCASTQSDSDTDADTGSNSDSSSSTNWFSDRSGNTGADRAAAAEASDSWRGGESSSSDSSGSDSGSSDSGGGGSD